MQLIYANDSILHSYVIERRTSRFKKRLAEMHYSLPAQCMVHPSALMMPVPFVQSEVDVGTVMIRTEIGYERLQRNMHTK